MHENPQPHPIPPPWPAPAADTGADHAQAAANGRVSRSTERCAMDMLEGVHDQIMDMLQADPDNAPDAAWEKTLELLVNESVHAVTVVLKQRRMRRNSRPKKPFDMVAFAARALGRPA